MFTGEEGLGIAVDTTGNAYVTGFTSSLTFPITPPAFQASGGSGAGPCVTFDPFDAFLSVLNADGTALFYSSYLASSGIDYGDAIDPDGNALVTGKTLSPNFPTTPNAVQSGKGDNNLSLADAFILKISAAPQVSADLRLIKADAPDPVLVGRNLTYTLTATNFGPDNATDVRLIDTLPAGVTLVSASPGCIGVPTVTCTLGTLAASVSTTASLVVIAPTGGQISNTARVFGNEFDPVPNNNFATAMTTVDASTDLALSISDFPAPLTSVPDSVTRAAGKT